MQWIQVAAASGNILGQRAIPFQFVVMFEGSGPLGAYAPTGGERLQVVARIWRNGDPPTITTTFDVAAVKMTFWDLDRLGAGNWQYDLNIQIGSTINTQSSGFGTIANGAMFPSGSSTQWMVYGACQIQPGGTLEQPTMRCSIDNGSSVGQLFDFGGIRRSSTARRDYLSLGGMRVLVVDNATTRLAVQGRDEHSNTSERTTYHRAEFFSVKLSALARSVVIQKTNSDSSREKILSDHDAPVPGLLQWEPTMTGVEGGMMFTTYLRAPEMTFQPQSWMHYMLFGSRAIYWSERYLIGGPEGSVGTVGMGLLPAFNRQDPRSYQLGSSNPAEATAQSTYFGEDQCAVAFVFETDPAVYQKSSRPADPPTIIVVPGRETDLNLADVSAIPFEPTDYSFQDDPGDDFSIDNPMGYAITWPRFAKPKQTHTLPFTLKESERNTLMSFIESAPGRVFKWTPPEIGGSPKLFRVVGDITESMAEAGRGPGTDSVLWSIAIPCVELVWYGTS